MMRSILRLAALAMVLNSYVAHAQDIHFSQFYESSILRNPSLTGIFAGDYKVGVAFREQWSSVSKPFQTAFVTAEARIPMKGEANDFLSIGLLSYYDKAGSISMSTLTVYPAINYSKSINPDKASFISVGFTGGFIQRSFDPTKATFDNQFQNDRFDPANATGETLPDPTFTQWDLGAGFSYNATTGQDNNISYVIGAGGYHFSRPKYSFYNDKNINTDIRWNGNAGINVQMSEIYSYQLHANYMNQGSYNELILGGLLGWNKMDPGSSRVVFALMGGLFYRLNDAVIPTLKLKYMDYSFGMSYDMNASKLSAVSKLRGGFEITIFKTGLFRDPKFEQSRTLCPHF
jgi:type IX secretion system PorP/SprF family membrane protein